MVPLGVLLKQELLSERGVRPDILHGQACESKKGEDFTLFKMVANSITTFSLFAIFDGHNGSAAAIYSKENLLNNVLSAIPSDLSRDEWIAALPRALVAGFVKTDKDFQDSAQLSGTTVTFVIIDEYVVTVASVGDSRCILESSEGSVYSLSEDHRLEDNNEEVQRVTACGGEVGRINIFGGAELGPLRCWPGGLCLSRSIGDMDVGEFIVPVPHVKQVKLSSAGGRLIIASDGVWDALSSEMVVSRCHGLPAGAAATKIVKEAIQMKGLRDDTTCIVIDIIKPKRLTPRGQSPPKKPEGRGLYKFLLCKGSFKTSSCPDKECPDAVIIMFEDGSAMLSKRLDIKYPVCNIFKMFICAVCQVEIRPAEAVSIHAAAGSLRPGRVHPWGGPFLCQSCQAKKEAMEGTRLSEDIVASQEEVM